MKDLAGRYRPGRPGWWKYKRRTTTEAIVGGIVGSLAAPAVLLLGRLDAGGRLRYVGRTGFLTVAQRREVAMFARAADPDSAHPWPQPLPAAWSGQFDQRDPVAYVPVLPVLVAEVVVDAAFEHGRWRHQVRHVRLRGDLTADETPPHDWTGS